MNIKELRIDRIKAKMNEHGLSARDLSKRAGLSESALSRILSGEVDPRVSTFMKIADVLKVDYVWLMGYGEQKEAKKEVDYNFDLAANMGEYLVVIEHYKKLSSSQKQDILKLMKFWDENNKQKGDSQEDHS